MINIASLIKKYLKDDMDESEKQELESWKNQSETNLRIFEKLTDDDYLIQAVGDAYKIDSDDVAQQKINVLIDADQQLIDAIDGQKTTVRSIWPRLSVAAAILVLLGISAVYILRKKQEIGTGVTKTQTAKPDMEPGQYKAQLILADGKIVALDSADNGVVAQQGGTQIANTDGKLVYDAKGGTEGEVLYNTLKTGRGQMYPLILPDNSRIWLNSSSSIRFPVVFTGNERRVEITGEAYFEIAHNSNHPFIVSFNGIDVRVLGTKFNVSAYPEDDVTKTTLLEGSVEVSHGIHHIRIKPGQQARANSGKINVVSGVDVGKEVAWKNGLFNFKNDRLESIMPQIARWYNVDVVYKSNSVKNIKITGEIERRTNLSEMLKILSFLNISYTIEGQKLILMEQ